MKERVKNWAEQVGMLTDGCIFKQMQKIAEEVVECSMEVANHELTGHYVPKMEKEFGDILFATKVGAYILGLDPEKCLEMACDKNDKRIGTGRMVNGSFRKFEDLINQ